MKYIFVFIFFLLFIYLSIHYLTSSNINYITKTEGYYIIDRLNYFNTFNEDDFKIRKCDNIDHCRTIYKNNLTEFTKSEKNHLKKLVEYSNKLLKPYKSLYNIPWTFCKIKPDMENGFPHTHDHVIFLSKYFFKTNLEDKIETLIHEKIHIYQRKYPEKTEILYKHFNFNKNNKNTEKRRANPDIDEYNYDYKGNEFYYQYNDNPRNINDIKKIYSKTSKELIEKYGNENEHPNEIFAYLISKKITTKTLKDNKIIEYIS